MSLRMHPRENVVETARRDLEGLVIGWRKHHDLTDAEVVSVVSDVLSLQLQRWAKYRIREERHGDTDKPGGLE